MYVANVLSGYCICFMHILQMFYMDVAYAYNSFQMFSGVFASVSDVCCKCFSCFGCILQVFHLDVSKVDQVLHMLQWDRPIVAACCSR
jgi:hypothetical protein